MRKKPEKILKEMAKAKTLYKTEVLAREYLSNRYDLNMMFMVTGYRVRNVILKEDYISLYDVSEIKK